MRLTSIEIGAFGHLKDLKLDLDSPIVVLLGPNEVGKSTIVHFLRTMLYGFRPANREQHPFAPWSGHAPEGSLSFRLEDGIEGRVSRRLLSAPQGTYVLDGVERDLRNQILPPFDHLDRRVFEAVYTLALQDLVRMEENAWGDVQDRLLGGMNVDFLRPAREVAASLEDESRSHWRNDGRGKPRSKELKSRIDILRNQRHDALERDLAIRELDRQIVHDEETFADLSEQYLALQARRRKVERLGPVRSRLAQIGAVRADAGNETELSGLPADPTVRLEELAYGAKEGTQELEALELKCRQLEQTSRGERLGDHALLENAAEIRLLDKRVSAHLDRVARLDDARSALNRAEASLEIVARSVLTRWDEDAARAVTAVAEPELRERVRQFDDADRQVREAQMREAAWLDAHGRRRSILAPALLVAIGFVAAVATWLVGLGTWAVVAVGVAAAGVFLGYRASRENRERKRRVENNPIPGLEAERTRRRIEVVSLMRNVPFPPSRLESPDILLVGEVSKIQQGLDRCREELQNVRSLTESVMEDDREARQLAAKCGVEVPGDFARIAAELLSGLDAAHERKELARAARSELDEMGERFERLRVHLDDIESERLGMVMRLSELGEGDFQSGLDAYRNRSRAAAALRVLEEALESECPDWREVQREIEEMRKRGEIEMLSDEEKAQLDHSIEETEGERRNLLGRLERRRADLKRLLEEPTVDQIDGELSYVEEHLRDAERVRDRLQVLANVIRRADETYRERHQPDVLRRAGQYLLQSTDGRYVRTLIEDGGGGLSVIGANQAFPVAADEPLSQGTRDQIYLSLRLAIADHLDEGRERLPVFLDETYVNWDRARRLRGLAVLKDLGARRQVFIFTCHPWLAEEAAATCDAKVEMLASPAHG